MKNIWLFVILLSISFIFAEWVGSCGTTAPNNEIIYSIQNYNKNKEQKSDLNRDLYWVPIQFHIIKQSDGSGGLNEIVLPDIIDELNMDYINANIRFYQYGEVDYILDSEFYSTNGDLEINELKSINNVENVIDIYAVASLSSDLGPLCGISSFTWFGIQGIIVANGCFDRYTVNHEIGHYFDLFHPHEDANGMEYVNGNSCSSRGDGICDTPADPDLSLPGMVNACGYTGNATDPNGQEYDDCQGYDACEFYGGPDVGNIMSYAPDNCVNHFTEEQYEKVEFILINQRSNYIILPDYVEFNVEVDGFNELDGDYDYVINPGESINLILNINIDDIWPVGANELILTLSSNEENVYIVSDQLYLPYLNSGESFINIEEPFQIQFNTNAEIKEYDFNLNIAYLSENTNFNETNFDIKLNVSLNQFGFPFEANSAIKSSPAIVDLDNDGINEIVFGSHGGVLFICETSMVNCVEFVADGQIWGSPAVEDIDNDGYFEIIFGSVDRYIYVLNHLGELEYSFDTEQFLVGTPAIGNMDIDDELEIIIGGFSPTSQLFVFNHDLTLVDNFPLNINEKIKEGVALADVNNDGIDEAFFGTEGHNFYRVDHEGYIFNNGPLFTAYDKIVFSPVVVNIQNNFLIGFGSDDGNFYLINSNGDLQFTYITDNKIRSSAAIGKINNEIFFAYGSENGFLYLIDLDGEDLPGWPVYIGEPIENAPVLFDFQSDNHPEVLVVGSNTIKILDMDGNFIESEIVSNYLFTSSPMINDLDLDGDLEFIVGTNYNLIGIDLKTSGDFQNYWSLYRGDLSRSGLFNYSELNNENKFEFDEFELAYPYPNPFNSKINIPLIVNQVGPCFVKIYNIKGEVVYKNNTYFNHLGNKQIAVDFDGYSSGTYFVRYGGSKSIINNKIILLK